MDCNDGAGFIIGITPLIVVYPTHLLTCQKMLPSRLNDGANPMKI